MYVPSTVSGGVSRLLESGSPGVTLVALVSACLVLLAALPARGLAQTSGNETPPCAAIHLIAPPGDRVAWAQAAASQGLSHELHLVGERPERCPWIQLAPGAPDWTIRVGLGSMVVATTTIAAREVERDRVSVLVKAVSTMNRAPQLALDERVPRRASEPPPAALPVSFLLPEPEPPTAEASLAMDRSDPEPPQPSVEIAVAEDPEPPPAAEQEPSPTGDPGPVAERELTEPEPETHQVLPPPESNHTFALTPELLLGAQLRSAALSGSIELGLVLSGLGPLRGGAWLRGTLPSPVVDSFAGTARGALGGGVCAWLVPSESLPRPGLRLGIEGRSYLEAPLEDERAVTVVTPLIGLELRQALRPRADRGLRPFLALGLQVDLRDQRFVFPTVLEDGSVSSDRTETLPPALGYLQLGVGGPTLPTARGGEAP